MSGESEGRSVRLPDLAVIAMIGIALYGPYVVEGGLLRDDLGFINIPNSFDSYGAFQRSVSTHQNMTARPVSACLHGVCYWCFGKSPWAYHSVNLVLFLGATLFYFGAIAKIFGRTPALLSAIFALVYPCASGVTFSSFMMNSNLAGLLWGAALYVESSTAKPGSVYRTDLVIMILLVLSALSYEAFIPLFLLIPLAGIPDQSDPRRAVSRTARRFIPIGAALLIVVLYRGVFEPTVFNTSFSRIDVVGPIHTGLRWWSSLVAGAKIATLGSLEVSLRAMRNLSSLDPLPLLLEIVAVCGLVFHVCFGTCPERLAPDRSQFIGLFALGAVICFCLAHMVFAVSTYRPDSWGFATRTQGAIRYAFGMTAAAGVMVLYTSTHSRRWKLAVKSGTATLLIFLALSMVGQREAWVSAARFNDGVVERVVAAITKLGLHLPAKTVIVAQLPATHPCDVNGEPIFGESWDIGPALQMRFPDKIVDANVYRSKDTKITDSGIVIGGYWQAAYPFYFFRFSDGRAFEIRHQKDMMDLIGR
jgi:hypothetical protein